MIAMKSSLVGQEDFSGVTNRSIGNRWWVIDTKNSCICKTLTSTQVTTQESCISGVHSINSRELNMSQSLLPAVQLVRISYQKEFAASVTLGRALCTLESFKLPRHATILYLLFLTHESLPNSLSKYFSSEKTSIKQ